MKKELFKYLVVMLVAFGGGPAGAALWQWSLSPAANNSADPTIAWINGQPSPATEPSGRAMMARLAEYRDDISGSLVSTGTLSSYLLTTKQSAGGTNSGLCGTGTVPIDGQLVAFTPHVTNGANPILAVDGCSSYAVWSQNLTFAPAGTLIAGTPYSLKYSAASLAWVLRDFYIDPYGVALGGLMAYTAASVPNSNFILPAGQCLSTATYNAYWGVLGNPGTGGCPGGQFPAPDLRGRVPAAIDTLNGSAANRMTTAGCGTAFTTVGVSCANGFESETLTLAQLPTGITAANASQSITVAGPTNSHTLYGNGANSVSLGSSSTQGGGIFSTNLTFSLANSISVTSNNTSGTAHPNVQPSIAVSYLLRVI